MVYKYENQIEKNNYEERQEDDDKLLERLMRNE